MRHFRDLVQGAGRALGVYGLGVQGVYGLDAEPSHQPLQSPKAFLDPKCHTPKLNILNPEAPKAPKPQNPKLP